MEVVIIKVNAGVREGRALLRAEGGTGIRGTVLARPVAPVPHGGKLLWLPRTEKSLKAVVGVIATHLVVPR